MEAFTKYSLQTPYIAGKLNIEKNGKSPEIGERSFETDFKADGKRSSQRKNGGEKHSKNGGERKLTWKGVGWCPKVDLLSKESVGHSAENRQKERQESEKVVRQTLP